MGLIYGTTVNESVAVKLHVDNQEDYIIQDDIQMLMRFFDFFCKKKKEKLEPTSEPDKEEPKTEEK